MMDYNDIFKDVERDMGVYDAPDANKGSGSDGFEIDAYIHGIFQRRPILGSEIIPEDVVEKIDRFTRSCIDGIGGKGKKSHLSLSDAEKVTMSLITHTKEGDFKNGKYWIYITEQYGYDATDNAKVTQIRVFFTKRLIKALTENDCERFFLKTESETYYSLTASLHAFAPKRYWFAILDFLFRFYTKNLKHALNLKDPILDTLLEGLHQSFVKELTSGRINDEASFDENVADFQSGIGAHNFHKGIKYLIIQREKYGKALLVGMIYRIEKLINDGNLSGDDYEDALCMEWYAKRTEEVREAKGKQSKSEIAYDKRSIKPRFVLGDADLDCLKITLPEIRCGNNSMCKLEIYYGYGERNVYDKYMPFYGDEYGMTLCDVDMVLPDFESVDDVRRIRVAIECNGESIYDSEDRLYRECMLFPINGGREIRQRDNAVNYGEYILVTPKGKPIGCDKAELEEFYGFKQDCIAGYLADFSEGFALVVDGKMILSDKRRNSVSVLPSVYRDFPVSYRRDGEEYRIISVESCMIIAKPGEDIDRCDIRKNGEKIVAGNLRDQSGADWTLLYLPVEEGCTVTFVNPKSGKRESYYAVKNLDVKFNRDYYYLENEYKDASCSFCFGDSRVYMSFSSSDEEIAVPHDFGEFVVKIPRVGITEDPEGPLLDGPTSVYLDDVKLESRLIVEAPNNVSVAFVAEDEKFSCSKSSKERYISVGNALRSHRLDDEACRSFDVRLEISAGERSSSYYSKSVYVAEEFEKYPFVVADNAKRLLHLDGAEKFVGRDDTDIIVTIFKSPQDKAKYYDYIFHKNEPCVAFDSSSGNSLGDEEIDDSYSYMIRIQPRGLFDADDPKIVFNDDGMPFSKILIGYEKIARFRECVLRLKPEYGEVMHRDWRTWSDRYEYRVREVEYEGYDLFGDSYADVYRGIFYAEDEKHVKRDFSFKEDAEGEAENGIPGVNPVRLSFLDDSSVLVMTRDGNWLGFAAYAPVDSPLDYIVELKDANFEYKYNAAGAGFVNGVVQIFNYEKVEEE